ncbi:hypothetical protein AMTRI_Chr06g174530 [Amborella trichopoda]
MILGLILLFLCPCCIDFLILLFLRPSFIIFLIFAPLLFLKGKHRNKTETILIKIPPTDPPRLLQLMSFVLLIRQFLDSWPPLALSAPCLINLLILGLLLHSLCPCFISLLILGFLLLFLCCCFVNFLILGLILLLLCPCLINYLILGLIFLFLRPTDPPLLLQRIISVLLLVDLLLRDASCLCHCPEPHLHTRQNPKKMLHQIL